MACAGNIREASRVEEVRFEVRESSLEEEVAVDVDDDEESGGRGGVRWRVSAMAAGERE